MTPMEIALLATGVIIFIISFLIPDRAPKKSTKDMEKEKEDIRRLMEKELDGMKLRVNEATNETVEYAMDKTERSLEKISNEKIMAVSEYSDTIMEEINKSHKEVMFLYDMLSDKQTDLKNTVRKAEATAKEVETISETAKKNLNVISVAREHDRNTVAEKPAAQMHPETDEKKKEPAPIVTNLRELEAEKPVDTQQGMQEKKKSSTGGNNNQKILALYEQGKSNVEIAKELNLGVGEVKLVIDLFKG